MNRGVGEEHKASILEYIVNKIIMEALLRKSTDNLTCIIIAFNKMLL